MAGIVSAYLLQRDFAVTLFERAPRLGGHTNTVTVTAGPDAGTQVDTGFIVFNDWTYPHFIRFLRELGVESVESEMSFGFWRQSTGLQYAGSNLNTLFGQRRNLLRPGFWRMLRDILRFNRAALADTQPGACLSADVSLEEYVQRLGLGSGFREDYLYPMAAAIWSTPPAEIGEFPARTFLHFFRNHGLLSASDRPQWRTVRGGSSRYIEAFRAQFSGEVVLNAGVQAVRGTTIMRRTESGSDDRAEHFDHVVIATHADQALAVLGESATAQERAALCPWRYQRNHTVLHSDGAAMPPTQRVWSSWNYIEEPGDSGGGRGRVSLTYDMNRLQHLRTQAPMLVTLNRQQPLAPGSIYHEELYEHPTYTRAALKGQRQLAALNQTGSAPGGTGRLFAGSYFGYGFHEDAVKSAVEAAALLGCGWGATTHAGVAPA